MLCLADETSASRGQESICLSLVLVRHKNGYLGNLVGGDILARSVFISRPNPVKNVLATDIVKFAIKMCMLAAVGMF